MALHKAALPRCLAHRHAAQRAIAPARRYLTCRAAAKLYKNKIGVHALVFAGGWSKEECIRTARGSREAGYDLVEIPAFQVDQMDPVMTRSVFADYDLQATTSLGLTLDADISNADPEIARRGKEQLLKALQFTAAVGGSIMGGPIYSAIAKYPGPPSAHGCGNCIAALRELAPMAADLGVTLCLEVINRYETNLINTTQQGMQLLSIINHPSVKLHIDSYHMNIEENNMEQAVLTAGRDIAYVHIGESHRGYLGTGQVDFKGLFNALAAIGYEGPITFESFSSAVVSEDLSNNLCVWRNMWEESGDVAGHARGFIHGQWGAAVMAHSR